MPGKEMSGSAVDKRTTMRITPVRTILKKILPKVYHLLFNDKRKSGVRYWRQRAKQHGRRSVFNLRHGEEELQAVTRKQKDILFPVLKQQLAGDERLALDFGCGPGRFTHDLARLIQGKAIGVDPIKTLIHLAPPFPDVEYKVMKAGRIPLPNNRVDVVWICIVLGGITDENLLRKSVAEIQRVLKKNGLVFLVENTADQPHQPHWKYRSVEIYRRLFQRVPLTYISAYDDLEEKISIMAGRKE